jgi:hypothetical protein
MGVIESSQTVPMDKQFKLSVSANGTIYMVDNADTRGDIPGWRKGHDYACGQG